jgi:hypothetical protein
MWARLASAALGIWLMAAPAVLGFGGVPADVHRVVGPLVASFAVISMSEVTRPLRWCNAALGALLAVAPALVSHPALASVDALSVGALLVALARVRGPIRHEIAGGWRAALGSWRGG